MDNPAAVQSAAQIALRLAGQYKSSGKVNLQQGDFQASLLNHQLQFFVDAETTESSPCRNGDTVTMRAVMSSRLSVY